MDPARRHPIVYARLEQVISLLTRAEKLYATVGDEARTILNKAVFGPFEVDSLSDDGATIPAVVRAPLAPVVGAVLATAGAVHARTPGELSLTEGSSMCHLAVAEGFEPSVGLHPQTLSRRSP